jgi:nitrogen regulatory protein P-II 2
MKIVMAIIKPFKLDETDQVDKTIEAITGAAKTGQIGDGKIFVLDLESAVRIRTGETDAAAI